MILTSNGGGQKKFDIKGSNPFSFQQTFSKLEFSSNYRDRGSQSKKCNHETTGCSIRFQNNGGWAQHWQYDWRLAGVWILIWSCDFVARFVGIIARYIIVPGPGCTKNNILARLCSQHPITIFHGSSLAWPAWDPDFHQPRKVILSRVDEDWPVKSRSSSWLCYYPHHHRHQLQD